MEVFGVALGSGEGVSGEEMVQIPSCHHSPQDEGIVGSLGSWRGHEEEEGKEQEMGLRRPQRQTSFCLRDSPGTLVEKIPVVLVRTAPLMCSRV